MLLAAAAAFAGAAVQSATGFGFALILGPAIFAVRGPEEAVSALLVLGFALNLLVLADGRRARVPWRPVAIALAAAVPGLVGGALVLTAVSKPTLQAAVGVAVIAAALVQIRARPAAAPHEPSLISASAVGLTSGALTTATSVSGPPLVLWFEAQGLPPREMRTSLSVCFLALNVAGAAALLAAAGTGSVASPVLVLPLLALVVLGHLVGARVFRRLDSRRFRALVLGLVVAAGAASLAAGVAGL
jgi:uncharacterized membrane protein YfcA